MSFKEFWLDYGNEVEGYHVKVLNEREGRAAAGLLMMLGMIVIFVGIGFNHIIVARVYLTFLFIDFTLRIINPNYSPSLLLGRFFVQNQKPEYVGAAQKRFAWLLGWFISLPMMWWFVLHWDITFYKVMICVACLTLMFFEGAFGICIGCVMYKWIFRECPSLCPGGVCEMHKKEPIQMFSPLQKAIVTTVFVGLFVGVYLFLAKTESKTFFGQFLHEAVLTDAQLKAEQEAKFEAEAAREFEEDDDF